MDYGVPRNTKLPLYRLQVRTARSTKWNQQRLEGVKLLVGARSLTWVSGTLVIRNQKNGDSRCLMEARSPTSHEALMAAD